MDELRWERERENFRNDREQRFILELAGGAETGLLAIERGVNMAGMRTQLVVFIGGECLKRRLQNTRGECAGSGYA